MTNDAPSPLPVKDFAYVELYVGNAKQAAYVYEHAYGFTPIAYAGPETGVRDRATYVMAQGGVRILLTAPMVPDTPIAKHVGRHTDGVRDVAFVTENVEDTFEKAVERGGKAVEKAETTTDDDGEVTRATIGTFGDTVHTLVDRSGYDGVWMPGFEALPGAEQVEPGVGFGRIDHTVGNVEEGKMDHWADYYTKVFGFRRFVSFDDKDISTDYTALRSVVMASENDMIKVPINEPAEGKKKSQIQEYLDFYPGPGVQHLAITTDDIIHTIAEMKARNVDFLDTPETYYADLKERVPQMEEAFDDLKRLKILVDQDENGYLLQLFTKPIQDRPTLFFEIIQRKGAESFGKGNFKALFKSIEAEQARRGNL